MSKFVDRMMGRMPPEGEHVEGEEMVREPKGDDGPPAAAPLMADEDAGELVSDYAKLGEHVTSVLEAARTAAAKIREDAREDARRVSERTRNEATKAIETARREADQVSAEAEQLRGEVEKESRETRERENASRAKARQDAEAEASGLVNRAKREAREHMRAAQERRDAMDTNVALTEERLRQLVGGLRDLAGRLEELLEGQPAVPTPDAADAAPSRSLEDSLRPSAAAQPSTERLT